MNHFHSRYYLGIMLLFLMSLTSCVKDVDLSQSAEISLQPDLQADLLIFEVASQDFLDPETNEYKKVIRDTVRLEFLDDSYIQDDLASVEFSFKYTSTITKSLKSSVYLLSENDSQNYQLDFDIPPGSQDSPSVVEKVDFIGVDRIDIVKKSIKMMVVIEAVADPAEFKGSLRFESKGLFSFVF